MKNNATILDRQSLLDIALQEYGTVEAVFDIVAANDFYMTKDLAAGEVIDLPESENTDHEILNFYEKKGIVPATLSSHTDISDLVTGIGIMKINKLINTFIIG